MTCCGTNGVWTGAVALATCVWLAIGVGAQPRTAPVAVREAQISADGRSITFGLGPSEPPGTGRARANLWRVPFVGGEPERLTSDDTEDSSPRWSPDGQLLAFLSRGLPESRPARIRVLASSGGTARSITDETIDVSLFAWSPDGRRIACVGRPSSAGGGTGTLWIQNLATGTVEHLSAPGGGLVTSLSWSPSGTAIAAVAGTSPSQARVVVFPMSGPERELGSDANVGDDVAWSPDGSLIAWLTRANGTNQGAGRVLVAPADGGAARVLSGAGGGLPLHVSWAGGRLSITVAGNQERHVDVLDVRTGERATVLPPGIAFVIGAPSWSADGTRYAVVGSTPEHPAEVFAGSLPQPLPRGRDSVGAPPPPVRRITFSNR